LKNSSIRKFLYLALVVLYLLHNDLWFWHDPRFVLGLPIGMLYHVCFCLCAALLMALLVTCAWPNHLDFDEEAKQ
jgi:hypothetical protein